MTISFEEEVSRLLAGRTDVLLLGSKEFMNAARRVVAIADKAAAMIQQPLYQADFRPRVIEPLVDQNGYLLADKTVAVGRDVHYISYGTPRGEYSSVCRAAKITEVYPSSAVGSVALVVFNPTGIFFDLGVEHSEDKEPGTWHWPSSDERAPAGTS